MEKMTHDYIRQTIPAEISERGGALLRLVGGKTIPLETSIREAKAAGYVLGDEELVRRQFEGLVKCMRDGTEADGMARQIGGWVTVYPVFFGPIDLTRGFDPEKNGVRIRMRLLNEIDVDITDWEFRDVTPGRTPFSIDSASTGELVNTVKVGDQIHVNGRPFPSHDALRVDWAVEGTDKSGTIPAEKFTSDATLITIAADALDELKDAQYDGRTIVFTVRGNFASAKISAKLKFAGPAPIATNSDGTVKCMSVVDPESPDLPELDDEWTIAFEGLADNAKWRYDSTAFKVGGETKDCEVTRDGDTLAFSCVEGVGPTGEYDGVITVKLVDKEDEETTDTVDIPVHFHATEH